MKAGPKDSGVEGLIVIDKPAGWTSHDVVAKIRKISGTRRAGHTGTLDPMATGVLAICLGRATRLIPYLEGSGGAAAKEYIAGVRFGFETTTDDAEGEATEDGRGRIPAPEELGKAVASMTGPIHQVPPRYSAKKIDGERAYDLARRGVAIDLAPVPVEISVAEVVDFSGDVATLRVSCSRGTYIRSLARDLGRALGTKAHLASLRRIRSGDAALAQALTLADLSTQDLLSHLTPLASILGDWPIVATDASAAILLRQGRRLPPRTPPDPEGRRFRALDAGGSLVALVRAEPQGLAPFCVF